MAFLPFEEPGLGLIAPIEDKYFPQFSMICQRSRERSVVAILNSREPYFSSLPADWL
jgi:hypothetical protein